MSEKIRFRLAKFECALVFQILWQDKSITAKKTSVFRFESSPLCLYSSAIMELCDHFVCIQGSDDYGVYAPINVKTFCTNEERDVYYEDVLRVFAEWRDNNYFEGTTKDKPKVTVKDNGVYSF